GRRGGRGRSGGNGESGWVGAAGGECPPLQVTGDGRRSAAAVERPRAAPVSRPVGPEGRGGGSVDAILGVLAWPTVDPAHEGRIALKGGDGEAGLGQGLEPGGGGGGAPHRHATAERGRVDD